jgi:hypothetical protein
MPELIPFLKDEIARIEKRHAKEIAPYRAALAAALQSEGAEARVVAESSGVRKRRKPSRKQAARVAEQKTPPAGDPSNTSKIDFVFDQIRDHHNSGGSKPLAIKEASPPEWTIKKSYPYTQLWKLKDAQFAVEHDGAYFLGPRGLEALEEE